MTPPNSPPILPHGPYWVVPPGRGRVPGIYDDYDATERQTYRFPNGRSYRRSTLGDARRKWSEEAPGYPIPPVSIGSQPSGPQPAGPPRRRVVVETEWGTVTQTDPTDDQIRGLRALGLWP